MPKTTSVKLTASFHAAYDTSNWLATNLRNDPWPSRYILDMPQQEREAWIAQTKEKKERGVSGNRRYFDRTVSMVRKQIAEGVMLSSITDYFGDVIEPAEGMTHDGVQAMFAGVGEILRQGGLFILYGPFNYRGRYTTEGNARFDQWLKARDPQSGIRDFEALQRLTEQHGMKLYRDFAMPANNRMLVWVKG